MAHVKQKAEDPALPQKHTFIRSYQACVACRKRKVRCDLGDPGNPSDPPCRRCRREHKECYFQDLRTKKGGQSRPGRSSRSPTRLRQPSIPPDLDTTGTDAPPAQSPGPFNTASYAYTPPSTSTNSHLGPVHGTNESATAERIIHKEVHNANEALTLLYEAAAESQSGSDDTGIGARSRIDPRYPSKLDPSTLAWRDFWCVKAGWMTDVEARSYVDLYVAFQFFAYQHEQLLR